MSQNCNKVKKSLLSSLTYETFQHVLRDLIEIVHKYHLKNSFDVDANSADEAESLALQSGTDWQFMDDDDYEVYQCEETD